MKIEQVFFDLIDVVNDVNSTDVVSLRKIAAMCDKQEKLALDKRIASIQLSNNASVTVDEIAAYCDLNKATVANKLSLNNVETIRCDVSKKSVISCANFEKHFINRTLRTKDEKLQLSNVSIYAKKFYKSEYQSCAIDLAFFAKESDIEICIFNDAIESFEVRVINHEIICIYENSFTNYRDAIADVIKFMQSEFELS